MFTTPHWYFGSSSNLLITYNVFKSVQGYEYIIRNIRWEWHGLVIIKYLHFDSYGYKEEFLVNQT